MAAQCRGRGAEPRVDALQARIRPHFLFNSMNTIASLTRTNPRAPRRRCRISRICSGPRCATTASAFRSSEELEIARAYERIEHLRLGPPAVDWQVDALPMEALVPRLFLQPLLENAVYHGIEPLAKGGTIRVTGKREGD